jgi:thiamine-monophosphate kinase
MQLSQLGEFGLIQKISRLSSLSKKVALGIGDDTAAVVGPDKGKYLLLTCDGVIENIHFFSGTPAYKIGWKAMARNLSDIAAMGGKPLYALVAASLPPSMTEKKALDIHRGLSAAAKRYGVAVIGGDTSRSRHGIHLTVTVVGEVDRTRMITRSGAHEGHVVCVTGSLGASILGKHLCFEPRVKEAQFLAKRFRPTSMMDLSDGLASDLQRLAEQSRVGFEIWADKIPISAGLRKQRFKKKQEIAHAFQDGEDYELLFTISPVVFSKLQKAWKKQFRLSLTQIGVVRPRNFGIRVLANNLSSKPMALPKVRNDHFFGKAV